MKKIYAWKIRIAYGIFLAAITVLLGLLYIFECADIYYSGVDSGEIFSRETVGQRLSVLLVPSVLWIVAIIIGYVLTALIPFVKKENQKRDKSTSARLLKRNLPVGESEEYKTEQTKLKTIEIARIVVWSFCAAFALAAAIVSIVYLTNISHFGGTDINAEIITMLRNILPWICVAFALCMGAEIFECVIAAKELRIVQSLYVLGQGGTPKQIKENTVLNKIEAFFSSNIFIYVTRLIVFCVAVVFLVVGIFNGGKDDVLMKAINICTECIGLG